MRRQGIERLQAATLNVLPLDEIQSQNLIQVYIVVSQSNLDQFAVLYNFPYYTSLADSIFRPHWSSFPFHMWHGYSGLDPTKRPIPDCVLVADRDAVHVTAEPARHEMLQQERCAFCQANPTNQKRCIAPGMNARAAMKSLPSKVYLRLFDNFVAGDSLSFGESDLCSNRYEFFGGGENRSS